MKAAIAALALLASSSALAQMSAGADSGRSRSGPPTAIDRRAVLTVDPLATVTGVALGAAVGAGIFTLPMQLEYAAMKSLAFTGQVTPVVGWGPGGTLAGVGIGAGVRWYVAGTAPQGAWAGASLTAASIGGTAGRVGVFDVGLGGGYSWVLDSGFAIGVNGGLWLISLASGSFPLYVGVPLGIAF